MTNFEQLLDGGNFTVETVGKPRKEGIVRKIMVGLIATFAIGGTGLHIYNNHSSNTASNDTHTVKSELKTDTSTIGSKEIVQEKNITTHTDTQNHGVSSIKKAVTDLFETNTQTKPAPVISHKETSYPIFDASPLVNAKNKELLNQAGNFDLPAGLADNQIARKVSQIQFTKENFYLALTSEAEGYRSTVYNDVGLYATGNGYNLSVQNKSYNESLLKAITKDVTVISKLSNLAGKHFESSLANEYRAYGIIPQRSMQISQLMGEKFKLGVIHNIAKHMAKNTVSIKLHHDTGESYEKLAQNMFDKMAPNEQAAMIYHTYKVGEGGSAKYVELHKALIGYELSPQKTPEMAKQVANKFQYKYKINGKVLSDERAAILIGTMFASKEGFGYIVGKNVAPKNFANLTTAIKNSHIGASSTGLSSDKTHHSQQKDNGTTSANGSDNTDNANLPKPGEFKLPDPVGDYKARLLLNGQTIHEELISATPTVTVGPKTSVLKNISTIRNQSTTNIPARPFFS